MSLPRIRLCCLPTPCHSLPHLSQELGVDLWIKRDDLTGFALGGNKGRKLEFLMAEALACGADTVVTCGAAQSNFVRQLAAACSVLGLRCVAALMDLPYSAVHGKPEKPVGLGEGGNLVLNQILGLETVYFPDDDWEVLYAHAEELAQAQEQRGAKVYRVPLGGSSPLGAYSFFLAARELTEEFDWVLCPCSSGSTHVGLAAQFEGSSTRVVGISADPEPEIMPDLVDLSAGLHELDPTAPALKESELDFRLDWAGVGYGIPSPEGQEALKMLARREGIFLDPIYSAKAFAGLLDLVRSGKVAGRVLFWHTGGTPTLFTGGL